MCSKSFLARGRLLCRLAPDVPQFEGVPEEDCQHGVWPFYGFGVKQRRINGLSFAALRQAQLYGYLVARTDRVYRPGSTRRLCGLQTAEEMVR
jgi:hypothetical protein